MKKLYAIRHAPVDDNFSMDPKFQESIDALAEFIIGNGVGNNYAVISSPVRYAYSLANMLNNAIKSSHSNQSSGLPKSLLTDDPYKEHAGILEPFPHFSLSEHFAGFGIPYLSPSTIIELFPYFAKFAAELQERSKTDKTITSATAIKMFEKEINKFINPNGISKPLISLVEAIASSVDVAIFVSHKSPIQNFARDFSQEFARTYDSQHSGTDYMQGVLVDYEKKTISKIGPKMKYVPL